MQTTKNEVNTSIFTKLMEIREMKTINASNKAELDNIEIEIADIKKKINELKLGDY